MQKEGSGQKHGIEIRNLALAAGQLALNIPYLRFLQGQTSCMVGRSGSGKSLFAAALSGLPMPGLHVTGTILLDGREQTSPLWRKHVFVLPQEPALALDPTMAVGRQLSEVFRWRHDPDSRWGSPAALGSALGLDVEDLGKFPEQLSGGMQQRVMIAMALAAQASFIIADEPTKGLDSENRARIIDLFGLIRRSGRGLVIITHDLEVARALANEVVVFDQGTIAEQGAATRVLDRPASDAARALVSSAPENWPKRSGTATCTVTGTATRTVTRTATGSAPSPVLSTRNAGFGFTRAAPVIRDASLDIHSGEIVGLRGPSGIGKSTLADLCLGLRKPQQGTVRWFGKALTAAVIGRQRARFQKLFQNPVTSFPPNLTIGTVFDKLTPIPAPASASGPFSRAALMERLQIDSALLERRPDQVSGGELQRLAIVRVMLAQPAFLACDEPSSRLDMSIQKLAIDIITDYAAENGAAILLISHDSAVLEKRADRILDMTGTGLVTLSPKAD